MLPLSRCDIGLPFLPMPDPMIPPEGPEDSEESFRFAPLEPKVLLMALFKLPTLMLNLLFWEFMAPAELIPIIYCS